MNVCSKLKPDHRDRVIRAALRGASKKELAEMELEFEDGRVGHLGASTIRHYIEDARYRPRELAAKLSVKIPDAPVTFDERMLS